MTSQKKIGPKSVLQDSSEISCLGLEKNVFILTDESWYRIGKMLTVLSKLFAILYFLLEINVKKTQLLELDYLLVKLMVFCSKDWFIERF